MKNHIKHLIFLLQCLVLALLFFGLSRFVFFGFTSDLFPQIYEDGFWQVFAHGLRFDLSAFAYFNLIFILLLVLPTRQREKKAYQKILQSLFVGFNGLILFMNLADVVNIEFTGKRMTADTFEFILQGDDLNFVAIDFIKDYWYLLLIATLMTLAMRSIYIFIQKNQFFLYRSKITWPCFIISLFALGLTVLAMRGGTQLRPIKNIHASYHGQGKYVPLILNAPFSILSTLSEKGLKEVNYFNQEERPKYFDAEKTFEADSANKKNVVIIILESFSREYIGYYNEHQGYTPFLDSLILQSTVCENAYANGKKSIEGIPAILSGIPALSDKPYILSQYGTQKTNSIPSLLSKEDYECSFYHGGNPGTMGFDAFAEMAGFHSYIDLSQYPNYENDFDGKWGIFDEPYFQFFKSELDQKKEPFFSSLFSLSSHHPYTIPEKHKGKFPKGEIPIHETIGYTDHALRRFFEEAKKSNWFENTLFVITADHTFTATHKEYQNSNGLYEIPLLIYNPADTSFKSITKICQQTDILPTIVDELNLSTKLISFGNSIWNEKGFAVNYLNNLYQFIDEGYLLQFNGNKSLALYQTHSDPMLKNNLLLTEISRAQMMENKLKALIQDYNYRMINNQLHLDD
jgi:phosphoglycerol transferase MdoB-like AlkP superfamily enzyme